MAKSQEEILAIIQRNLQDKAVQNQGAPQDGPDPSPPIEITGKPAPDEPDKPDKPAKKLVRTVKNAAGETYAMYSDGSSELVSAPAAPAAAAATARASRDPRAVGPGGDAGLDVDPSTGRMDPSKEPVPRGATSVADATPDEPAFVQTPTPTPTARPTPSIAAPASTERREPIMAPRSERFTPSSQDVFSGVVWAESHGRHTDDFGDVILGPRTSSGKRAIGVSQLMPDTAKALGVNPYNRDQNLAGGLKYLEQMKEEFGTWEKAIAAYNAGPARVHEYEHGRPLPVETLKYVKEVMNHIGATDISPGALTAAKRQSTSEDVNDTVVAMIHGREHEPSDTRNTTDLDAVFPSSGVEEVMNTIGRNVMLGAAEVPLGQAQTIARQFSPEKAEELTKQYEQWKSMGLGGSQLDETHPIVAAASHAVGGALGYAAEFGLLTTGVGEVAGAVGLSGMGTLFARTIPSLVSRIGPRILASIVGTIGGLTSYHDHTPEEGEVLAEGVAGGIGGLLIGQISKSLYQGARRFTETRAFQEFSRWVGEFAGETGQAAQELKDAFVGVFDRKQTVKDYKYQLRNQAGEVMNPGFDRTEMSNPLKEAEERSTYAGVPITPTASAGARKANEALGKTAADRLEAQHQAAVEQYDKDIEKWTKARDRVIPYTGVSPDAMAQMERQAVRQGLLPPKPVDPGEFVPPPVSPQQYAAARTAINRVIGRSQDADTRTQLRMMRDALRRSARRGAEAAGVPEAQFKQFEKLGEEADRYMHEEFGPIRERFGSDPGSLDKADFYNRVVTMVESRGMVDVTDLKKFASQLGSQGPEKVFKVLANRLVEKMSDVKTSALRTGKTGGGLSEMAAKAADYLSENRQTIEALGGKETLDKLQGVANLAQKLAVNPKMTHRILHVLADHGWLQALGAAKVFEGLYHEKPDQIGSGAAMIGAPIAGAYLGRMIIKAMDLPGVLPVVREAGRIGGRDLDTAKMNRMLGEFERRIRVGWAPAMSYSFGQSVAGAAQPLAPLGALPGQIIPGLLGLQ